MGGKGSGTTRAGGEHDTLLAVADDLYAGDLGGFTAARDARAAEVKVDDPDLAKRIKALRKPTVAAWALDLFVRAQSEQVDQLLALGEALREAQESLDGEELRALTRQRRQLTAAMTARVRSYASGRGQRLTQSVADQVEATLTAALLDAQVAVALRSGMLVQPVTSTGVDAVDLTAVVAVPEALGFTAPPRDAEPDEQRAEEQEPTGRPRLRVVPDPDETRKKRRAARAELAEAERVLSRATRALRTHDRKVADLEARALQVQAQIDEVRRRLAELEATAEQVDVDLAEAVEERDDVAAEVDEAAAERDDARALLEALDED